MEAARIERCIKRDLSLSLTVLIASLQMPHSPFSSGCFERRLRSPLFGRRFPLPATRHVSECDTRRMHQQDAAELFGAILSCRGQSVDRTMLTEPVLSPWLDGLLACLVASTTFQLCHLNPHPPRSAAISGGNVEPCSMPRAHP